MEFPLLRFKFCDSLKLILGHDLSVKQVIGKLMSVAMNTSRSQGLEFLKKIFLKEGSEAKIERLGGSGELKSKVDLIQIRVKKVVKIDRNPPSPYSIERVRNGKKSPRAIAELPLDLI